MKKATLLIAVLIGSIYSGYSQKIKEKDILGTWKLVIDVKDKLYNEAEEADNMLEETIIKMVSGFVGGIIEDIDIYFEFKKNNKALITVKAYGKTEIEEAKWYINKSGFVEIDDVEAENINIGASDDEWKLKDGLLVNDDDEDTVYMTKVD